MNTAWRPTLLTGSLCALAALLAGCSAGSGNGLGGKAGNQSSLEPEAIITPIGHVPAPDGTLYVRSGAEVLLSAKDSDGRDSAILGVTWAPANAAAQGLRMIERGATAMSFRAPQPVDDTPVELRFSLTVRASDGDTASSEIRILVSRVPDPNDFLLSDVSTTADAVNLVVVASAATSTPTFATDIPFTIGVQKQVRYKRAINTGTNPSASPAANDPLYCLSSDPLMTCVKIGPPLQLTGTWKAGSGVAGTLRLLGTPLTVMGAAYQNPRFRLRPPTLNADEVNFAVLTNGIATNLNGTGVPPEDARRNNLLYTADIDSAEAEYAFTMSSSELGATGRRVDLLVFAADSTAAPSSLSFLAEGQATATTDPGIATVTGTQAFNSIKTAPGVVESRNSALAYYTAIDPNGRRTTLDDWLNDNCMQRALAGAPGYYGSDIHATYLNDRDLGFGREMYFKTNCTTAQQGLTGATINTTGGERASIVFNYPSLEAAIKRSGSFLAVAMEYRADAAGGPKYTRFYTFAPDPRTRVWKRVASANFDGRRERYTPGNCTVCHGGKPRATYPATAGGGDLGATFVPWDADALLFSDTDKSILDERLKAGFTRGEQLPNIQALNVQGVKPIVISRIAETQAANDNNVLLRWNATLDLLDKWYSDPAKYAYVPPAWHGGTSTATPSLTSDTIYGQVIAGNCRMCHMQRITDPGPTGLTLASAPQFSTFADIDGDLAVETTRLKQRIFEQHVMPASRLTSDRFWIAQPGSSLSAAQVLAAHLGLTLPAAIPVVAAVAPDRLPDVDPSAGPVAVRLSGLSSRFASTYSWTLQTPVGKSSSAVLVGANTAEPAFAADVSGTYLASLTVTDTAGRQSVLSPPVTIVANRLPKGGHYIISPDPTYGSQVVVNLFGGGGAAGDTPSLVTIPGTGNPASPAGTNPAVDEISGCVTTCTLRFTATSSGTIYYTIKDSNNDSASGDIMFDVKVPNAWNLGPFSRTCTSPCSGSISINPTTLAQAELAAQNIQIANPSISACIYRTLIPTPSCFSSDITTRLGRTSRNGGAAASATAITYSSPAFFVSKQGSSDVLDSFQFRITVRDPANGNAIVLQSQPATVNLTVNPRATWSADGVTDTGVTTDGVFAILNSGTCSGSSCHTPAPTYTDRAWGLTADGSGRDTYDQLGGSGRTNCPAGDTKPPYCVNFEDTLGNNAVTSSYILHKPLGEFSHGGGPTALLNAAQIAVIQNWISDGAYRN